MSGLEIFFLVCFLVGVTLSVLSFVGGTWHLPHFHVHVPHVHLPQGHAMLHAGGAPHAACKGPGSRPKVRPATSSARAGLPSGGQDQDEQLCPQAAGARLEESSLSTAPRKLVAIKPLP